MKLYVHEIVYTLHIDRGIYVLVPSFFFTSHSHSPDGGEEGFVSLGTVPLLLVLMPVLVTLPQRIIL